MDIITKSSAYFKQLIDVVSPNEIGSFPSDVIARGISLIYKLKRIVLRVSPYFTPVLLVNFSPIKSLYMRLFVVVSYIDFIICN